MERTISKRYYKMIKLQKKLANVENNEERTTLKKELDKVLYYKRKLEYIFNNYSILPTNKWVGEQLGLSDSTIAVYLNKIKKKLLERNSSFSI